jgi:hypothetical protein
VIKFFIFISLFSYGVDGQTLKSKIDAVHSSETLINLFADHRAEVKERLQAYQNSKRLPEGIVQTHERLVVEGRVRPELMGMPKLVQNTLSQLLGARSELLKRSFPEEDLPVLERVIKNIQRSSFQSHYFRILGQKLDKTDLSGMNVLALDWRAFVKTPKGKAFLEDKEQVMHVLELQREASFEAEELAMTELLEPLKPHSIRVLLSYAYEVVAPQSSAVYQLSTTEEDVENFIASLKK